jgi:hypothetical protein
LVLKSRDQTAESEEPPKTNVQRAESRRNKKAAWEPGRGEPLGVRVPREINLRLKRLDYLLAERGVDTSKAELVHMCLAQLPRDPDDALVKRLLAFQAGVRGKSTSGGDD